MVTFLMTFLNIFLWVILAFIGICIFTVILYFVGILLEWFKIKDVPQEYDIYDEASYIDKI